MPSHEVLGRQAPGAHGRNPHTGEPLRIRAGKAARITPGAGLEQAVAGRRHK